MNVIKKICNVVLGTQFYIGTYHAPSKDKLLLNHFVQAEQRGKVLWDELPDYIGATKPT